MQTAPTPAPTFAPIAPTFAPLVPTCRVHGMGKTRAHELAAAGILETFKLGRTRMVVIESLRTLPERLAAANESAK